MESERYNGEAQELYHALMGRKAVDLVFMFTFQ